MINYVIGISGAASQFLVFGFVAGMTIFCIPSALVKLAGYVIDLIRVL